MAADPRRRRRRRRARGSRRFGLLVLVLLAVVTGFVFVQGPLRGRVDAEVRARAEAMLAEQFPDFHVRVQGGKWHEGRGFQLTRVTLAPRERRDRPVVSVEEVFISCRASLTELRSTLMIEQIALRRLRLHAERSSDGRWNFEPLLQVRAPDSWLPPIIVRDSSVTWELPESQPPLQWRDLELQAAQIESDEPGDGKPRYRVTLSFTGNEFQRVEADARTLPDSGAWGVEGRVTDLRLTSRLWESVSRELPPELDRLQALRARVSFGFRAAWGGELSEPQYRLWGTLKEGEYRDAQLPWPLTAVAARFEVDQKNVHLTEVSGIANRARLTGWCRIQPQPTGSPRVELECTARDLRISEEVARAAPEPAGSWWEILRPDGVVDGTVHLVRENDRWDGTATVDVRDTSFTYRGFAYPLEKGRGRVVFDGSQFRFRDFLAEAGGQLVHLDGDIGLGDAPGWMEFRTDGPVALDEVLVGSLSPSVQHVVSSLQPQGRIRVVHGRIARETFAGPIERSLELELVDCSVAYERFPYAITKVQGTLMLDEHGGRVQQLTGYHGASFISCHGGWTHQTAEAPGTLGLRFVGSDVPLDDELRDAVGHLKPGALQIWIGLRPRGTLDRLQVDLDIRAGKLPTVEILAEKRDVENNIEGRSISLHPSWFPYRLDRVQGSVRVADGEVHITDLSADHDGTGITVQGTLSFLPAGGWVLDFTRFVADGLRLDGSLREAVSGELQQALTKLRIRGALHLDGRVHVVRPSREAPLSSNWEMRLAGENVEIDAGLLLEHVHGGVRLEGETGPDHFECRGELEVDSLLYRGVQFSGVQGPLFLDRTQLVLGAWAEAGRRDRPPRHVIGRAVGGDVDLDARVLFQPQTPFLLQTSVRDCDLSELAQDFMPLNRSFTGRLLASLQLSGNRSGMHTWRGSGSLRLRDANLAELHAMVALLSFLSLRPPDSTAITSGDIDFRLQGEHLYFDRLILRSNAVTLVGTENGWMSLRRELNVRFYAVIGRDDFPFQVLRLIVAEASRKIFLVEVTGTLENPQFHRIPLPELDEALRSLQSILAEGNGTRGPPRDP